MKLKFESYLNAKSDFDILKNVVLKLSGIRNDFIFLHINSFGASFESVHLKYEDYYNNLSEDIDTLLEIIAMNTEKVLLDLNKNPYKSDKSKWLSNEDELIYAGINLIEDLLKELENARKTVSENEALVSEIDSIAYYWSKERSYFLKRFVL
jgi:DNA-binding ferritin-like protein